MAPGDSRTPPSDTPCLSRVQPSARSDTRAPQISAKTGIDAITSANPISTGASACCPLRWSRASIAYRSTMNSCNTISRPSSARL